MNVVIIRLVDLPTALHGAVRVDIDGIFNIYLNSRLSEHEKHKTLFHELRHIVQGHIGNELMPLWAKEQEADDESIMIDLKDFMFLTA